jgi:hypothetical protein
MSDRLQQAAKKALNGDISRTDYYRYWLAVMRDRQYELDRGCAIPATGGHPAPDDLHRSPEPEVPA